MRQKCKCGKKMKSTKITKGAHTGKIVMVCPNITNGRATDHSVGKYYWPDGSRA